MAQTLKRQMEERRALRVVRNISTITVKTLHLICLYQQMMELELVSGCQAFKGELEERSTMGMVRKLIN